MGEIRTVKGRERERTTAVERVVVTPQRQKLLGKSMPRQPHNRRGMCASGAFEAQSCAAYPPTAATLPLRLTDED
jgi:hypothetical protein